MLPIIVEGRGLIPRGHGLAPKKDPFPASPVLISHILNTAGLKPIFVDPVSKKRMPLTKENYQRVYRNYEDKLNGIRKETPAQEIKETKQESPIQISIPAPPVVPPIITPPVVQVNPPVVNEPKVEEPKKDEKKEEVEVIEEKKSDSEFSMKPVTKPEDSPSKNKEENPNKPK